MWDYMQGTIPRHAIMCYHTSCIESTVRVKTLNVVVCMCNVYNYECDYEWTDKKTCE